MKNKGRRMTSVSVKHLFNLLPLLFLFISCGKTNGVAPGSSSSTTPTGPCINTSKCMIFVTAATYDGNLGGVSGADQKCNSDANNKNSGTYKALIAVSGQRDINTDWPLYQSQTYVRADGSTVIGTTTQSGMFTFNLTNSISSSNLTAMTGIDKTNWGVSSMNCSGFTTNNGCFFCNGFSSSNTAAVDTTAITNFESSQGGGGYTPCSAKVHLLCVEQ